MRHTTASFTAQDKEYDGTTTANVTNRTVTALQGTDNVTLTGDAAFDSPNVGTGKTVEIATPDLGGTDATNYFLDSVDTDTAAITARPIAVP